MAGLYSKVLNKLQVPRLLSASDQPSAQAKVQEAKDKFAADPLFKPQSSYLAQLYAQLRDRRAHVEEVLSGVNIDLEAVTQMMSDRFETEGLTKLTLANGRTISIGLEPYAQVTDKEAVRLWCISEGLEQKMSVPWQTLNELTKKRLLAGEELPPGVTLFSKIKVRQLGGGAEDSND